MKDTGLPALLLPWVLVLPWRNAGTAGLTLQVCTLQKQHQSKGREDMITIDQPKSRANEPLGKVHTDLLTEPNLALKAGMRSLAYLQPTLTAKLYIFVLINCNYKEK